MKLRHPVGARNSFRVLLSVEEKRGMNSTLRYSSQYAILSVFAAHSLNAINASLRSNGFITSLRL